MATLFYNEPIMEARRQQLLGLAVITLLILLIVIVRHFWSAA